MKSSEISTREATQVLEKVAVPEAVKQELHQTLTILKNLLKDNPEFLKKLVQKCLWVGKKSWQEKEAVFFDDIEDMIELEYPNYLQYADGHKLLQSSWVFMNQLCLKSKLIEPLIEQDTANSKDIFRELLENESITYLNYDLSASEQIQSAQLIGETSHEI